MSSNIILRNITLQMHNKHKSYLSNRNQHVSIDGYKFGFAALSCGVPQGSVLGPLLSW